MPSPDGVLAAIDEAPKRPAPADFPRLRADPDVVRRAGETLAAQMPAFVEALQPAVEQTMRTVAAFRWAFAALAGASGTRDLADAEKRRRAMKSEYRRRRR